jgi:outer membrane protein assembly factor BamB
MMNAACLAGLAVITLSAVMADDWPQYRGPDHNGISKEKISKWPESGPKPLWKMAMKAGFSSITEEAGIVATLVNRDYQGVPHEFVIALNADTGKELWANPLSVSKYDNGGNSGTDNNKGGDGARSTPSFDNGLVYVLDAKLNLYCFEAKTGAEKWKRDLTKDHKAQNVRWQNAASPLIQGDLIYLASGGPGQSLLAINKTDGKTVWKGEDDAITHATPAFGMIHGHPQVIFFTQKGLVSCEPKTGKVLWRHDYPFSVSTAASPIIAGDIVYCSAGYGVGAGAAKIERKRDIWKATELWRSTGNKLANHWSTPVLKDGKLYGMFQFKEYGTGALKCVDIATGNEIWSQPNFGPGNVTLVGDKILALSDAGQLVLIQATPQKYTELARFQAVNGKCWSTPSMSDGRIYVRSTIEGACYDVGGRLTQR